jgi:hypothetical protein
MEAGAEHAPSENINNIKTAPDARTIFIARISMFAK